MEIKRLSVNSYLGRPWRYLYTLVRLIRHGMPLPIHNIFEAGGRKCGKTESFNRFFWMVAILAPQYRFTFYTIRLQQGNRRDCFNEALKVAPNAENVFGTSNISQFKIKGRNFIWQMLGMLDRGRQKGVQKLGLPRYNADYTFILFEEASEFTADHMHMVKNAVRLAENTLIIGLGNPYFPHSPFFLEMYEHFPPPIKILMDKTKGRAFQIKADTLCQWTNIFSVMQEPYFSKADFRELEKGLQQAPLTGRTSLYGIPMALKGALYPEPVLNKIKYFTNPHSVMQLGNVDVEILAGLDFGFTSDPWAFIWGFKDPLTSRIALMGGFKGSANESGEFDTLAFANRVYKYLITNVLPYLIRHKKTLLVWTDSHSLSLTSSLNQQLPTILQGKVEFRPVSKKFRMPLTVVLRIERVLDMLSNNKIFFKTNEAGNQELHKEWRSSYGKEPDNLEMAPPLKRIAPFGDHLQDAFEYGFVESL